MTDQTSRASTRSRAQPSTQGPPGLGTVLQRNIAMLNDRRKAEEEQASFEDRLALTITRFTGSIMFVYIHLAFFAFWIVANLGWIPGVPVWDASFVVLAMWASVEAVSYTHLTLPTTSRV